MARGQAGIGENGEPGEGFHANPGMLTGSIENSAQIGDSVHTNGMPIRVLMFASIAELAGNCELSLDSAGLPDAGSVLSRLIRTYPSLESRRGIILVAVNSEFARPETPVSDGDEIAFFPPVSGG